MFYLYVHFKCLTDLLQKNTFCDTFVKMFFVVKQSLLNIFEQSLLIIPSHHPPAMGDKRREAGKCKLQDSRSLREQPPQLNGGAELTPLENYDNGSVCVCIVCEEKVSDPKYDPKQRKNVTLQLKLHYFQKCVNDDVIYYI